MNRRAVAEKCQLYNNIVFMPVRVQSEGTRKSKPQSRHFRGISSKLINKTQLRVVQQCFTFKCFDLKVVYTLVEGECSHHCANPAQTLLPAAPYSLLEARPARRSKVTIFGYANTSLSLQVACTHVFLHFGLSLYVFSDETDSHVLTKWACSRCFETLTTLSRSTDST